MFLRNCWYVAAWDNEVGREPFARTILNEPVVLFRIESGEAVALEDRCCHRQLMLTEPARPLAPILATRDIVTAMGESDQVLVLLRERRHQQVNLRPGEVARARVATKKKMKHAIVRRSGGEMHRG